MPSPRTIPRTESTQIPTSFVNKNAGTVTVLTAVENRYKESLTRQYGMVDTHCCVRDEAA